jgi:hypothetical protein
MKQDLKFWYNHIFMSMKQRIKGLNMMREIGELSPDDFAQKVMAEVDEFDRRNLEFINTYVAPENRNDFRRMIKKLSEPKPSLFSKFMQFFGL